MKDHKKYKLGDDIDAYCKRCGLNLDASVSALQNNEIVQVMCRTCLTVQPFKSPVNLAEKKNKALNRVLKLREKKIKSENETKIKESVSSENPDALWDQLMEEYDFRKAKPYAQDRSYQLKDFILHKIHGVGIVVNIIDEYNIQIIFRESLQIIPQNQEQEN